MKPHDIEATAKARRRIPHLAFPDDGACQFLGVIAGVVGEGDGGAARDAFDVVGDRCHAARANVAEQAVQVGGRTGVHAALGGPGVFAQILEEDAAAGRVGDDIGDLGVAQRLGSGQREGLVPKALIVERRDGDGGDVADVDERDAPVADRQADRTARGGASLAWQ